MSIRNQSTRISTARPHVRTTSLTLFPQCPGRSCSLFQGCIACRPVRTSAGGSPELAHSRLPPSAVIDLRLGNTSNNGSWGVHGRILPYLEQTNLYNVVDLTLGWDFQPAISGLRVPVYSCPSDPRTDEIRDPGGDRPLLDPTNYGFNFGRYFVFNPQTRRGGDGLFYPN